MSYYGKPPILISGTTAFTQTAGDNSLKVATTAYVFNAIQGAFVGTNTYYVAKNGIDAPGGGSIFSPFKTIAYAMTQVTGQSGTNPYTLALLDNYYNETVQILLKPNVGIFTFNQECVINNSLPLILDSASWSTLSGIGYNYINNATFGGDVNLDWSIAGGSAIPFLQFDQIEFLGGLTLNGQVSTAVYMYDSYVTYGTLITNLYFLDFNNAYADNFQVGTTTLNVVTATCYSTGSQFFLTVLCQTNAAEVTANLLQFKNATFFDTVTADGNEANISYDVASWQTTTLLNGAPTPTITSLSNGLLSNHVGNNYTAADNSVNGALIGIDNALGAISGGGIISVTGTTTLTSSAYGQTVVCTGATSYTITLPSVSANANQYINFLFEQNAGVIVTISGSTINNVTSLLYGKYESVRINGVANTSWQTSQEYLMPVIIRYGLAGTISSPPKVVIFDTKIQDNLNFYNATTGIITPVGYAGTYEITAVVITSGTILTSGTETLTLINSNGDNSEASIDYNPTTINLQAILQCPTFCNGISDNFYFNWTDNVASQSIGGSIIKNYLYVKRILNY